MKEFLYHSGFEQPTLYWRVAGEQSFHNVTMEFSDAGRTGQECLWAAQVEVAADACVEFFIQGASPEGGTRRDPSNRWYESCSRVCFLQDGQIFTYRPHAKVEPARRGYQNGQPEVLWSNIMQEDRGFRVYLPRGYRQHVNRRYPVLYLQDGQNIFDSGSFGSWNAQVMINRCIERGQVEEMIVVAIDHTQGRWDDYVPQEDGGQNQRYAQFLVQELKPHIDRLYRTRKGPQDTALLGSSLGGVCALSIAWDYFHIFGKVGSLSGSWWLKKFQQRMLKQSRRPLRIYLDSGNAGPYNDCIHHTLALRDDLQNQLGYRLGQDLCHVVGDQHSHTEGAWGFRLRHALRFLFPAQSAPEQNPAQPLRRAA